MSDLNKNHLELLHLQEWLNHEPDDRFCTVSWMKNIAARWQKDRTDLLTQLASETARADAYKIALTEISRGEGAFSCDPQTHANNTIENMKSIALQALEDKP